MDQQTATKVGGGPNGPTPILELRAVTKRYGKVEAVRGVDLSLHEGELMTLLGPSGSGKTTVLKMVAGFVDITSGGIWLRGQDISELAPSEREIGMVFQNYALFPHLTVAENVDYPLKLRKWSSEKRKARVVQMLELVGLPDHQERLPRELSGGQQQRVALARALSFNPSLLLMDEPLGALDRELREHMMVELRRIHQEVNVTALYVTHDREEALTLADRVGIMRGGLVEAVGTASELLTAPDSEFVASFFGSHALLPAKVVRYGEGGQGRSTTVTIQCLGQTIDVNVRPERDELEGAISVVVPAPAIAGTPPTSGSALEIDARVVSVLDLGDRLKITCSIPDLESSDKAVLLKISGEQFGAGAHEVAAGHNIRLYADAGRIVPVAKEEVS
jgi:ABC-type Fe3+/spermidine/putrescine transport system ATPase subunit